MSNSMAGPPSHRISRLIPELDKFTILQDGQVVSALELARNARKLVDSVDRLQVRSLAVSTRRSDVLVSVLRACCELDLSLLILREMPSLDDPLWGACGIEALVNDDLDVTRIRKYSGGDALQWPKAGHGSLFLATSGTSGAPKIVRHSLDSLLARVQDHSSSSQARWLMTYHPASFAGLQVLLTAMVTDSELVAPTVQSVGRLAEVALSTLPSHISGTPTFWRSFLLILGDRITQISPKQITLGGESVNQNILDRLQRSFPGVRIVHIYASTEAGALFSVKDGRAGFPVSWLDEGVEGNRLRIRDGILEVKSVRAMQGYVHAGTAESITEDKWLRTGDLVRVADDRVHFVGRADGVINVGGAKVVPEAIEELLLALPQIRDVCVYGVANPITGAVVGAQVVLSPGASENATRQAIAELAPEKLERYQVPKVIEFVDNLTVNASGKKVRV